MKAKNCLIFGGSGQIGRNLIRKLTSNNYKVTVVTRNIHQKSYIIKTQANAGYIDIVEANIFEENKIRELFKKADICIRHKGSRLTFRPINSPSTAIILPNFKSFGKSFLYNWILLLILTYIYESKKLSNFWWKWSNWQTSDKKVNPK